MKNEVRKIIDTTDVCTMPELVLCLKAGHCSSRHHYVAGIHHRKDQLFIRSSVEGVCDACLDELEGELTP